MKASSVWDGIAKILHVCQKNSILNIKHEGNLITCIRYGPLGSLLKQNIFKEWISSFLFYNEVSMLFPVEILKPRQLSFQKSTFTENIDSNVLENIVQYYGEALNLAGNHLPLGIIFHGSCIQNVSDKKVSIDDQQILWRPETWSRGSMFFFCAPNKAMHWFYYWQRQRYLWWRKFSNVPSQFSMSDIAQTKEGGQEMSLLLDCPWGKEKIETINLIENGYFSNVIHEHDLLRKVNNLDENSIEKLSVVTCEVEIDLAVFAYLSNSFVHKWRNGELQSIFQFHSKFAPYKVSICLHMKDVTDIKKLNDVASHLIKDLKKNGISVFPNNELKSPTFPQLQLKKFDEIGLPYSVILDEMFLKNGIAGLRSRDTTLQEQVHVTEIVSKLATYLKIMETPLS